MVVRALQQHFADVSARLGAEWSESEPRATEAAAPAAGTAVRTA
jgi:hypothetical protein